MNDVRGVEQTPCGQPIRKCRCHVLLEGCARKVQLGAGTHLRGPDLNPNLNLNLNLNLSQIKIRIKNWPHAALLLTKLRLPHPVQPTVGLCRFFDIWYFEAAYLRNVDRFGQDPCP